MRKRICSSVLLASLLVFLLSILNIVPSLRAVPAQAADAGHITGQLLDGSNHNAPLASQQVTLQMAHETLQNIFGARERTVTVEMIQKAIADHYNMRVQDLKAKNNSKAVAELRQIAMYFCKKLTGFSLSQIGREFGNKHHTTVLSACEKIQERLKVDAALRSEIHAIEAQLLR